MCLHDSPPSTGNSSDLVRERAAAVATDAEVAEFLRYGWLSAAGIDTDAFRLRYVLEESALYPGAGQAVMAAQATNPETAAQAWAAVSEYTVYPRTSWADREQYARDQAAAWQQTAEAAGAAQSPLQAGFATKALTVRRQWLTEVTNATERSAWWTAVNQLALDAGAGR